MQKGVKPRDQALTLSLEREKMRNYNLNDLRQWKPVGIGEILDFPMPAAGFRAVHFDVIAAGTVAVHAVTAGEQTWVVGYGDGYMEIKFAIDADFGLVFVGDADTDVFIRSQLDAPIIPESEEASYTTIEPRSPGVSDDFRRMMQIVKLNQARREAEMQAELDRQAQQLANLQAAQQTPAPAPATAPSDPVVE